MNPNDFKKLRESLDSIDSLGENLGENINKGTKFIVSKLKFLLIILFAGICVFALSVFNGIRKK